MVDLTHARLDRAHVLAPGLFRSLAPGQRKAEKLDITYRFGDTETVRFVGFEPLGAFDMRVLQALSAMAGPGGIVLTRSADTSAVGRQLLLDLFQPDPMLAKAESLPDSVVVRDSFRELARVMGAGDDGRTIRRIRDSIERLYGVSIFVHRDGRRQGFRLLSSYASDEESGGLYVALNPRLASAVLGGPGIQHARISLVEARSLTTDAARLIHQRLSGFINPGAGCEVSESTLVGYVWPVEAGTDRANRQRLTTMRKALEEVKGAGWRVSKPRDGIWHFIRPRDAVDAPKKPRAN